MGQLPHDHGHLGFDLGVIPKDDDFQIVADIFKQLCDGSRIRIFWVLCHCEECVTNLASIVGMSAPAVSHHLRSLKTSGLIVSRRVGKEVYYRAADTDQAGILHNTVERLVQVTCPME